MSQFGSIITGGPSACWPEWPSLSRLHIFRRKFFLLTSSGVKADARATWSTGSLVRGHGDLLEA